VNGPHLGITLVLRDKLADSRVSGFGFELFYRPPLVIEDQLNEELRLSRGGGDNAWPKRPVRRPDAFSPV